MITEETSSALKLRASAGENLEICGKTYPPMALQAISGSARHGKSHLTIHNSEGLSSRHKKVILSANPGNVTFK